MPLEHLLAALERDAGAHTESLLAEARARAAGIAAEADERVARRRGEALGVREVELRGAAEVALAVARRAARGATLEARERCLERVFTAARAMLPDAVRSEAYHAALPERVAAALRAIGDEPAVLRCSEPLVPVVRAVVSRKKHLSVQGNPDVAAGFRLATTDGTVEVDDTLDAWLERLRPSLALALLERLGERA